ncbi:MAG TPA: isoprenylcysteine carboxylmethyltransferase family protein [Verrucomicrobiae bacterium]|jgi:protein-S-isoprenylcysteine O-methyltransferase Ste14|nr:isoprenylcysteine carboxylmethyltransferase family protein [Verrucomicrobiae bacterium]
MTRKHIVMTVAVGAALVLLFRKHPPKEWNAVTILGMCLVIFGFVMWTIAHFQMGASFSATAQARHLVTQGIYAKIRNPIYVFSACLIAGAILLFFKPVWLLIFVILIPVQIWRAKKESAVLEAAFGDEYRTYRAGTWF